MPTCSRQLLVYKLIEVCLPQCQLPRHEEPSLIAKIEKFRLTVLVGCVLLVEHVVRGHDLPTVRTRVQRWRNRLHGQNNVLTAVVRGDCFLLVVPVGRLSLFFTNHR